MKCDVDGKMTWLEPWLKFGSFERSLSSRFKEVNDVHLSEVTAFVSLRFLDVNVSKVKR